MKRLSFSLLNGKKRKNDRITSVVSYPQISLKEGSHLCNSALTDTGNINVAWKLVLDVR